MSIIALNVRKLRGSMTQTEFAKKVGVSPATIHRIESRKNYQIESLLRIAFSCGLRPYEMCITEEEKREVQLRTDLLIASFKEAIKKEILSELKK